MANERFYQGPYWDNLGIAYSGGTFTIQGALGRSLSTDNPAYVVLPSQTTPGEFVKYTITADQNFIDDAGASEIIGNLFGAVTGRAWGNACPFYIYAVPNDAETAIQFMIARIPHATVSPAAADIGAPDDAVADGETDFWSLDNIDETLYDANPCLCVGSFRMVMSASDDWTVQAITNDSTANDGIGCYNDNTIFTYPAGQNGNDASSYFIAGGGTVPVFSTSSYTYSLSKDGYCKLFFEFNGDGGTDGSGAVALKMGVPLTAELSGNTNVDSISLGIANVSFAGGSATREFPLISSADPDTFFIYTSSSFVSYSDFTNGSRQITCVGRYLINK